MNRRGILTSLVLGALVPLVGKPARAPKHHTGPGAWEDEYQVGDTVECVPGQVHICVVPGKKCLVMFGGHMGERALLVPKP